ncbi:MAG TPA: hypothetical protein VGN34_07935 [Ktedonobacteraceae bacterium]
MATANQYGTLNPASIDPYPIETPLATEATGGSAAIANAMLNTYQRQRLDSENAAYSELQGQHQFARDQLAQQLAEARMKAVPEFFKAGLGGVAGGEYGLVDPNDPNVQQAIQQYNDMQSTERFQKGATGLNQATMGGFQPSGDQASAITGVTNLAQNIDTPAQMKLKGDLARAAASAARGNEPGAPSVTKSGPPVGGVQTNFTYGPKTHLTQAQIDADFASRTANSQVTPKIPGLPPAPASTTMAQRDPGGSQDTTQSTVTAPTKSGPRMPADVKIMQNDDPQVSRLQKSVVANYTTMPKATADDIRRGSTGNGGQPIIAMTPKGPAAVGASGQLYQ